MLEFAKKKLQVFVSSTYDDLIEERQAAVEAILTAGHIPAGMELFAAGDESQMKTIMRWIEESDIFLLILGGRYGSIESNTKKSYIQLEYEYALSMKKPVFACVIKDAALEQRVLDKGASVLERENPLQLQAFRAKVLQMMSGFWVDAKDIKIEIGKALKVIEMRDSLSGWIRLDDKDNTPPASVIKVAKTRRKDLLQEFHDRKYTTSKFDLLAVAVKDFLKEIALDPENRMVKQILRNGTRCQIVFVHPQSEFLVQRAKEDRSDVESVIALQIDSIKYVVMFYKKLQNFIEKESLDQNKFGNIKIRLIDKNPYLTIERFGHDLNWGIYTSYEEGKNCVMFSVSDKEDDTQAIIFDQLKHHFYDLLDHGEPLLTLTNGILDLNHNTLDPLLTEQERNKLLM